MTNHYLACGAFDCLLSDSPCQCFSWFIGKWREFRASSSWVFGSWEAANSGTAEGTENADRQNWKDHFDSRGMYESFSEILLFGTHSIAPNPLEIHQTLHFASICQEKKLNAYTPTSPTSPTNII